MDENKSRVSRYAKIHEISRIANENAGKEPRRHTPTPESFSVAQKPVEAISRTVVNRSHDTQPSLKPIDYQNTAIATGMGNDKNFLGTFMLDENEETSFSRITPISGNDYIDIRPMNETMIIGQNTNKPLEQNNLVAVTQLSSDEIDSIVQEVLVGIEIPLEVLNEPVVLPDEHQVVDNNTITPALTNAEEVITEPIKSGKKAKRFKFGKKNKEDDLGGQEEAANPANVKGKKKSSKWYKFGIGFFTFCNICALICFFLAYGPFSYLRDLFVTTAMRTMTHKYLANVLYSTETIQTILANNITLEPDEIMNENAIIIGQIKEPDVYSSIYEEHVLKKDEGNDLYKIIRIDEKGYKGWITFIYDPTKVQLAVTKDLGKVGERVTAMAKRTNAKVAINGAGFMDYAINPGGHPTGYVIKEGKIVWSRNRGGNWGGGTIGFNQDGVMLLLKDRGKAAVKKGVYNGVDFGPFLIINGKSGEVKGNGGWGIHPRTVIGQRKDGIVIFLTIDGRTTDSIGIGLNDVIEIMKRYDAYNVANLDGGSSTVLVVEGKVKNNPVAFTNTGERGVATAWIVVE